MQHLYEGYKQIIERVLELDDRVVPKSSTVISDNISDMSPNKKHLDLVLEPNGRISGSFTSDSVLDQKGVAISRSARKRFERLKDRIQLIVLSNIDEFNTEKEALVNTVCQSPIILLEDKFSRLNRTNTLNLSISTSMLKKTPSPLLSSRALELCLQNFLSSSSPYL